jgi:hypothetical protein
MQANALQLSTAKSCPPFRFQSRLPGQGFDPHHSRVIGIGFDAGFTHCAVVATSYRKIVERAKWQATQHIPLHRGPGITVLAEVAL